MNIENKKLRSKQRRKYAQRLWSWDISWTVGFPCFLLPNQNSTYENEPSFKNGLAWYSLKSVVQDKNPGQLFVNNRDWKRCQNSVKVLVEDYPEFCKKHFHSVVDWQKRFWNLADTLEYWLATPDHSYPSKSDCQFHSIREAILIAESMKPASESVKPLQKWFDKFQNPLQAILRYEPYNNSNSESQSFDRAREIVILSQLYPALIESNVQLPILELLTATYTTTLDPRKLTSNVGRLFKDLKSAISNSAEVSLPSTVFNEQSTCPSLRDRIVSLLTSILDQRKSQQVAALRFLASIFNPSVRKGLTKIQESLSNCRRNLISIGNSFNSIPVHEKVSMGGLFREKIGKWNPNKHITECQQNQLSSILRSLKFLPVTKLSLDFSTALGTFLFEFKNQSESSHQFIHNILFYLMNEKNFPVTLNMATRLFAGLSQVASSTGKHQLLLDCFLKDRFYVGNLCIIEAWLDPENGFSRFSNISKPLDSQSLTRSLNRFLFLLEEFCKLDCEKPAHNVFKSLPALAISDIPLETAVNFVFELNEQKVVDFLHTRDLQFFSEISNSPKQAVFLFDRFDGYSHEIINLKPLSQDIMGRRLILMWFQKNQWNQLEKSSNLFESMGKNIGNDLVFSILKKVSSQYVGFENSLFDSEQCPWLATYPRELHRYLRVLDLALPTGRDTVRKVLSNYFPHKPHIEKEISFLKQELVNQKNKGNLKKVAWIERRLSNRIEMQKKAPVLSSDRLKKIKQKLRTRILKSFEDSLEREFLKECVKRIPEKFNFCIEDLLHQPLLANVLYQVLDLKPKQRDLGVFLLKLSAAGKPVSELCFQRNRKFVHQMTEQNIQMNPWLDGARELNVNPSGKKPIRLSFATQPMDYLLMGQHFGTCLSPDQFNFFSTISNAVDVNKKVIYGRTADGKVVGRCLIALSNTGKIVQFRCYSHNKEDRFCESVDKFLDQLAIDMNTVRTSQTVAISKLVSSNWYDDGVVCSYESEKLAKVLKEMFQKTPLQKQTDEEWLLRFKDVYTRLLDQRNSPFCFEIDDFKVAEAVWEVVVGECFCRSANTEQIFRLASIAFEQEQFGSTDRLLNSIDESMFLKKFRQSSCRHDGCYRFHGVGKTKFVRYVIDQFPASFGLRLMKSSRKKGIHRDLDEVDRSRREMLANLHERLHRKNLPKILRVKK